jgi:hypothetical protein
MKLNGWQRLWVAACVIYFVILASFVVVIFPQPSEIKHRASFYQALPPEARASLVRSETEANPKVRELLQVLCEVDQRKDDQQITRANNGEQLCFKGDVTDANKSEIVQQYNQILQREVSDERLRMGGTALLAWVMLCAIIYAVGWAIVWIRRGFQGHTKIV